MFKTFKVCVLTLAALSLTAPFAIADEILQQGGWSVQYTAKVNMSRDGQSAIIQEEEDDIEVCISATNVMLVDGFAENFALKPFFRYDCDFGTAEKSKDNSFSVYDMTYTCKPPAGEVTGTVNMKFSEYDWDDDDGKTSQVAFINIEQAMRMGSNTGTLSLGVTARSPKGKLCS